MSDPFYAEIRMLPYTFAPRFWGRCDGQLMDISQNTALFSLVGTTYGGDGRVSFGLPNLQGRAPLHWGTAPGLSPHYWGEMDGEPQVVLTRDEMPSHDHQVSAAFGTPDTITDEGQNNYLGPQFDPNITPYKQPFDGNNQVKMSYETIGVSGGSQAHENRQPYLAVQFCICLMGDWPPRN